MDAQYWAGGGPQGVGHRISTAHTRAIVRAVVEGRLHEFPARRDSIFGVHVLSAVPEVPADVLNPRSARLDPDEHDRRARPLTAMFDHNMGRIGEATSVAGWWQPILLARIGELQMPALGRLVQAED